MRKIGITGGIGSGKSFVSHILETRFGIPIYNSDAQAKRLMTEDQSLVQGLQSLLGKDAYLPDGRLNRPFIASYLFASPRHAARINALVHPIVCEDFERWSLAQTSATVGVESAILLESGLEKLVDDILLVEAGEETRLQRTIKRDQTHAESVRARMAQQDIAAMRLAATWIINNEKDNNENDIYKQIKELGIC